MLSLTLAFFFVVMIAALFGVFGISTGLSALVWVGFCLVTVAFLASLIWYVHLGRRSSPPV